MCEQKAPPIHSKLAKSLERENPAVDRILRKSRERTEARRRTKMGYRETAEEDDHEAMSLRCEKPNPKTGPLPPSKRRAARWSDIWLKNTTPLKNMIFAMQLASPNPKSAHKTLIPNWANIDRTSLLSDEILLKILAKLPESQRKPSSVVCKRWLNLHGRLVRSIKILDWNFLQSGRLISRFPNLNQVDLLSGSLIPDQNSGILLSCRMLSVHTGSGFSPNQRVLESNLLPAEVVDRGLDGLASGCPNLRKLVVIGASELGLLSVAEECPTLQELELHKCSDNVLRGIAACENLQVLKLVANVDGLYSSVVSDTGLTILAQGCTRLVKLELWGCEGSFDGIKAIGQCCQMLEELTFCDHRMDGGWLAALPYCENLKTLRFQSCKRIDTVPGPDEYLSACPALERMHLEKCQLRDKKIVRALFMVCRAAKEIVFKNCWGLENDMFRLASTCRRVKLLSLEGCSVLTTEGLESVILAWKALECLRVASCKSLKDKEISPALSTLFSTLKELQWGPDTKSLLQSRINGTTIGKKGSRFFRKTRDLKMLFDDQNPLLEFIHR